MTKELKLIDKLSDGAGRTNEDCFGFAESAVWVLDGATGLSNRRLLGGPSDARTYVEAINDAFLKMADESRDLRQLVRQAVETVTKRFANDISREAVHRFELPSASMAIVRTRDDVMEYGVLGDCKVLVEFCSGAVDIFGESRLEELDQRGIEKVKQLHSEGIQNHEEVRSHINATLREHRALMNTPGGYWTLGFVAETADHLCYGRIRLSEVSRVLLLSDGFYDLVSMFHCFTNSELVRVASNKGLEFLRDRLRLTESMDRQCVAYPRFKPSDDATAVLLELVTEKIEKKSMAEGSVLNLAVSE